MNFAMSGGIECFYFDANISENVEIGDDFSETVFVDGPCINVDTVAGAEKKSKSTILKSRGMITTCTENSFDPSPAPSQPQQSIQTTIKRPLLQFLNSNNQQQTILIRFNNSNCKAQSQQDENCHAKSFLPSAGLGLKTCLDEMAKLKCRQCSYQACYGKQLEEHVSTLHSSEALDRCLCCQMIFFNDDDLKIHYQKNHPKCYCSECGFISQHGYVMRRHMQSHTEEGRKCMFCSKLYKDRYVLNMHLKMVHSPVEKSFTCTTCSKSFNRKAHLVRHERTHAPKKPFICHHPNCNYSASERSDLSKHSLVHGEPQFKCNVCSKKFRQSKNRDLHLKRHTGQRDYKCGWCNFYGYTFTDIRKHIERQHTKDQQQQQLSLNNDNGSNDIETTTTLINNIITPTQQQISETQPCITDEPACDDYLVMPSNAAYNQQNINDDARASYGVINSHNNSVDISNSDDNDIINNINDNIEVDNSMAVHSDVIDDDDDDDDMAPTNICLDVASFDENLPMYEITKSELTFDDDDDDNVTCC